MLLYSIFLINKLRSCDNELQDHVKRQVGELAEAIAFNWLKKEADRKQCDPVDEKSWTSKIDPTAGYDFEVDRRIFAPDRPDGDIFEPGNTTKNCLVEVKGTSSSMMTQFWMSSNEYDTMNEQARDSDYVVLLVCGIDLQVKNSGSVSGWLTKCALEGCFRPSEYLVDVPKR